ncbi:MAG TPA: hypothetical protein VGR47_19290 [Terracidiphilus sp.]|nr:hypothetical protein [Terracidiphilus sp.]
MAGFWQTRIAAGLISGHQPSLESSSEIPNCGFEVVSSACLSRISVFLYHHAVAIPPSTAEAMAIRPNLIQPEGGGGSLGVFDEAFDSTGVAISDTAPGPGLNPGLRA